MIVAGGSSATSALSTPATASPPDQQLPRRPHHPTEGNRMPVRPTAVRPALRRTTIRRGSSMIAGRRLWASRSSLTCVTLAVMALAASSGSAAENSRGEGSLRAAIATSRLTPVIQSVPSPPRWFVADDGRVHLEYELLLTNATPVPVKLASLEVLSGRGARIDRLSGPRLQAATGWEGANAPDDHAGTVHHRDRVDRPNVRPSERAPEAARAPAHDQPPARDCRPRRSSPTRARTSRSHAVPRRSSRRRCAAGGGSRWVGRWGRTVVPCNRSTELYATASASRSTSPPCSTPRAARTSETPLVTQATSTTGSPSWLWVPARWSTP